MGATLCLLLFLVGFGIVTIFHQANRRIRQQIELDRFTGRIAIQLRASLVTLENSEKRLRIAKAAMIAGCAFPPSCPAFMRAYQLHQKVEEKIQFLAQENWRAQEWTWRLHSPLLSRKSDLSDLSKIREEQEQVIRIQQNGLLSSAKVWKTREGSSNGWKVAWIQ